MNDDLRFRIESKRTVDRARQTKAIQKKVATKATLTSIGNRNDKAGTYQVIQNGELKSNLGQKIYNTPSKAGDIVQLNQSGQIYALDEQLADPSPIRQSTGTARNANPSKGLNYRGIYNGYLNAQKWTLELIDPKLTSNIKYVYVLIDPITSEKNIYVAGWKKGKSKLILTLPSDTTINHLSIDNHGGNKYSVDLKYTNSTGTWLKYQSSEERKTWLYKVTFGSPINYRNGFWKLGTRNTGSVSGSNNSGDNPAPEYPSCIGYDSFVSTNSRSFGELVYLFNNQEITQSYSTTVSTENRSYANTFEAVGDIYNSCRPSTGKTSDKSDTTIIAPYTITASLFGANVLTNQTLDTTSGVYTYTNPDNPFDATLTQEFTYDVTQSVSELYSIVQVSESGDQAIGYYTANYGGTTAPTTIYYSFLKGVVYSSTSELTGDNDVFKTYITGIQSYDVELLKTKDQKVEVKYFDEKLKYKKTKKVKLFAPDQDLQFETIASISYHQ